MTRAERAAAVAKLRAYGFTFREIAAALGISPSYAAALYDDPTGAKDRARKHSYAGTCRKCGAATDGSNGRGQAPDLCAKCERELRYEERTWTPERIINVIRAHATNGRPPSARVFLLGPGPATTVQAAQREFGSWRAAVLAAGFDAPTIGRRYLDPTWTSANVIEAIQAWASEHGEPPFYREWDRATEARPHASTVCDLFGSWNAGMAAAGYAPRRPRGRAKVAA